MKLFFEYLFRVLGRGRLFFAMINFGLTAATILSGIGFNVLLPSWAWLAILVVSVFVGGFLAYRDAVQSRPSAARFQFSSLEKLSFSSSG